MSYADRSFADTDRLLRAWERAASVAAPVRGLALLNALEHVAGGETPLSCVEAALVSYRIAWFGRVAPMLAGCPDCGAEYELQLDLADLHWTEDPPGRVEITCGDQRISVRPPDGTDMVALAHITAPDAFADALFERCVEHGGEASKELRALAADALSQAGHAPRSIDVACGACGTHWQPLIDGTGLLWTEIDAHARRLLHEVRLLAAAFHWTEHDILALSPARRAFYLASVA